MNDRADDNPLAGVDHGSRFSHDSWVLNCAEPRLGVLTIWYEPVSVNSRMLRLFVVDEPGKPKPMKRPSRSLE